MLVCIKCKQRRGCVSASKVCVEAGDSSQIFGVLYIDLDRFKLINDAFGHEAGSLPSELAAIIEESGIASHHLCLELIERMVMRHSGRVFR